FFFSSRRRHTRFSRDWSSDVCSSDLRRDGAAADTATQPFEVDAEWMEFIGQRAFRASGNVELVRGALRGFSNWAEFDNETERLVLTGSARVLDEQYELTAERIEAVPVGAQLSE